MDEFYFQRSHLPAFGSWDCYDDLPFTQCFESARQAGLLRYRYSGAGDLYQNDILTPAMIVVPPRLTPGKTGYTTTKEKERKKETWAGCNCEFGLESPPRAAAAAAAAPKAVDEDLYKISPSLLRQQPKRKRGWGIFSSCMRPTCVC